MEKKRNLQPLGQKPSLHQERRERREPLLLLWLEQNMQCPPQAHSLPPGPQLDAILVVTLGGNTEQEMGYWTGVPESHPIQPLSLCILSILRKIALLCYALPTTMY